MSQSNDEFLGRLGFISELRELRQRLDRLERFAAGDAAPQGDVVTGEGEALQGTPPVRHLNAKFVGGYPVAAEARPSALIPTDPQGDVDYRRSGGIVKVNALIAGYGDDSATIHGQDDTYRLWVGASAAASAPFSVTQVGAVAITNGSFVFGSASTITLAFSGLLTSIVSFSSSGTAAVGLDSGTGSTAVLIFYENQSPRWATYHNTACQSQYDIYSFNSGVAANVLSLGYAAGSARINAPLAVFDGPGGSQIIDGAASGIALKNHTRLEANKRLGLDGTAACAYLIFDSTASKVRLYISGSQSASWA